jgi:hypothetical protein
MKRDMDLVRQIMLNVEGMPAGPPIQYPVGEIEDRVLLAHLEMLISAGLVSGKISQSLGSRGDVIIISGLTWEGHEWIETVRRDDIWSQVKDLLMGQGGVLTYELTKAVAGQLVRKRLGLPE